MNVLAEMNYRLNGYAETVNVMFDITSFSKKKEIDKTVCVVGLTPNNTVKNPICKAVYFLDNFGDKAFIVDSCTATDGHIEIRFTVPEYDDIEQET